MLFDLRAIFSRAGHLGNEGHLAVFIHTLEVFTAASISLSRLFVGSLQRPQRAWRKQKSPAGYTRLGFDFGEFRIFA